MMKCMVLALLAITLCLGLPALAADANPPKAGEAPVDAKTAFEQRYQDWKAWREKNPKMKPWGGMEFRKLSDLGVAAVPLLMAKVEASKDDAALVLAVAAITKKTFGEPLVPKGKEEDPETLAPLYLKWWKEGRKETRAQFDKAYAEFKAVKVAGENLMSTDEVIYDDTTKMMKVVKDKRTKVGEAYLALKNMGIDILPMLVEKVKAKDYDLLPLFADMGAQRVVGGVDLEKRGEMFLKWYDTNKAKLTIPE